MRTINWKTVLIGIILMTVAAVTATPAAGSVFAEVIPGPYEEFTLPWYYNHWLSEPWPTIGTNGDGKTLLITSPNAVVVAFPGDYESTDNPFVYGYDIKVYCTGSYQMNIWVSSAAEPTNQACWWPSGWYGDIELDFDDHPSPDSVKYVTIAPIAGHWVSLDAVESIYPPSNQSPVADAGPDQTIECACQTPEGTQVTLDGTGSTDSDEDSLTYTWTGPFLESPASGATPIITLGCVGQYEITLVVNDGQVDSEPDTVIITVEDTTAPVISRPGDITVEAMDPDGVPVEDDEIQTFLAGASATDNCDSEPAIVNDAPTIFQSGDTTVTFTATDASGNISTCQATVTVVEAAEAHIRIVPRIINRDGRLPAILAVIRFPEGVTEDDIDMEEPLVLFPGDSPYGIEATCQRIVTWRRWGKLHVSIFSFFPKDDITSAIPEDGLAELIVVGRLVNGQYFYGIDTVRIISWHWKHW
jgi:hypothetical protein